MSNIYIYKTNGNYLGFIYNDNVFSRDGVYLGWLENNNLFWHYNGNFGGSLIKLNDHYYIIKNQLQISPIPRVPRVHPISPVPPIPQQNILPIQLPIGYINTFK